MHMGVFACVAFFTDHLQRALLGALGWPQFELPFLLSGSARLIIPLIVRLIVTAWWLVVGLCSLPLVRFHSPTPSRIWWRRAALFFLLVGSTLLLFITPTTVETLSHLYKTPSGSYQAPSKRSLYLSSVS